MWFLTTVPYISFSPLEGPHGASSSHVVAGGRCSPVLRARGLSKQRCNVQLLSRAHHAMRWRSTHRHLRPARGCALGHAWHPWPHIRWHWHARVHHTRRSLSSGHTRESWRHPHIGRLQIHSGRHALHVLHVRREWHTGVHTRVHHIRRHVRTRPDGRRHGAAAHPWTTWTTWTTAEHGEQGLPLEAPV